MNTTPISPYLLAGLLILCIQFCKMLFHSDYLVLIMVA